MLERLIQGHALCFFPEGTSTDGQRVLPFKSTLFASLHKFGAGRDIWVQPASVIYHPAPHLSDDFYGLWGDMAMLGHLTSVLARSRGGRAEIWLHDPVRTSDFPDRKALARHCERIIRAGVEARLRLT